MWTPAVPLLELALRSAVIYVALLVGLRAFGKREVGQFTLYDLALVLLVANAVQPAMTGPDTSLLGGFVIMVTLFVLNRGVAFLVGRSASFRRFAQGEATVVARDGHWIPEAMKREGLDLEDCLMALREHGMDKIEDVDLAVLETDGTLSVVPQDTGVQRGKRRVRSRRI